MINNKELMIGNYLKNKKTGEIVEVLEIYDTRISIGMKILINLKQMSVPLSNYEPIPLTPEILEACGFEKEEDNYTMKVNEQLFVYYGGYERIVRLCFYDGNYSYPVHYKNAGNQFQYLHQLQNLFYSLTGEELTFQQP